LAKQKKTAMMCAEAVPWRCHRSLIADALAVRGIRAAHIVSGKRVQVHTLTSFACVQGDRIIYPGDPREGAESPRLHVSLKPARL
jgi:uncharacterized protein (DUF488 family)